MSDATTSAVQRLHDPQATPVVLAASVDRDVPVTIYGLDVSYGPQVTLADTDELASLGERGPNALGAGLMRFRSRHFDSPSATTIGDAGDAGDEARLIKPHAVWTGWLPVRVQLSDTWTRGRTMVALVIDGSRIARLWLDTIKGGR